MRALRGFIISALVASFTACDPGFTVRGTVKHRGGAPVASARIEMRCPGEPRIGLAGTTDAHGVFVLPRTLGCIDMTCEVHVVAPDGAIGTSRVDDWCTQKKWACILGCSGADVRVELP